MGQSGESSPVCINRLKRGMNIYALSEHVSKGS